MSKKRSHSRLSLAAFGSWIRRWKEERKKCRVCGKKKQGYQCKGGFFCVHCLIMIWNVLLNPPIRLWPSLGGSWEQWSDAHRN